MQTHFNHCELSIVLPKMLQRSKTVYLGMLMKSNVKEDVIYKRLV